MYQVEVKFMVKEKEVKLDIYASSAKELCQKISDVLEEKSKWNILRFFK